MSALSSYYFNELYFWLLILSCILGIYPIGAGRNETFVFQRKRMVNCTSGGISSLPPMPDTRAATTFAVMGCACLLSALASASAL